MNEPTTQFRARHKLLLASLATVTLSLGAVSIAWAGGNPSHSAPPNDNFGAVVSADASDGGVDGQQVSDRAQARNDARRAEADEVGGVDCEDGIVKGTTTECDGGPAANLADDPTEADEVGGVDCEDGIVKGTTTECDGGPAANATDDNGAEDGTEATG